MQKYFKQWILLTFFASALAMAEPLQGQNNPSSSVAAPAPVSPQQQAAIGKLLDAIEVDKLIAAIGNSAQMQARQLVPQALSEALTANKTLTDEQKRALIPYLEKNSVPKLAKQAGQVFTSAQFHQDALQLQYDAYAKYYTIQEIEDLTKFYKSPTGRKFIQVQDQVGHDVVRGLMQKYMPLSLQATRALTDNEIIAAKSALPSEPSSKTAK